MKNKTGRIGGFVLGVTGFLVMFKLCFFLIFHQKMSSLQELWFFVSVLNGVLFAFKGSVIQNHFVKEGH